MRARDVQEEDDEDREAGKDRIGLWRKRMRCRDKICPWRKRMCRDGRSPHCLPQPFPSPSPPPSSPSSPSPTSLSFSPSACSARPGHCARTVAASSPIGCLTCLSHLGSQRRGSLFLHNDLCLLVHKTQLLFPCSHLFACTQEDHCWCVSLCASSLLPEDFGIVLWCIFSTSMSPCRNALEQPVK